MGDERTSLFLQNTVEEGVDDPEHNLVAAAVDDLFILSDTENADMNI